MSKITTIWTYQLNGVQTEFAVNFDYLSRKFVQVTLIGKDRKVLRMNVDYRFIGPKTIKTNKAWGSSDGYQYLEIRRVTSATDSIVDFSDGSILRAGDLTIANLQSMHIAEEARNLAGDALGVNDEGHLDARARRIVNLGNPVGRLDAVNKAYVDDAAGSVIDSKNKALQYRNEAQGFRNEAESFKNTASSKASEISSKITTAEALNQQAIISSNKAQQYAGDAQRSASAASTAEKNAKASDKNAASSADRAEAAASKVELTGTFVKPKYLNISDTFNDLKDGVYYAIHDGSVESSRPINKAGTLEVSADGYLQRYYVWNSPQCWWRHVKDKGSHWTYSPWYRMDGMRPKTLTPNRTETDLNTFKEDCIYTRYTTPSSDWEGLHYPERQAGFLQVFGAWNKQDSVLGTFQVYTTYLGVIYVRFYDGDTSRWSEWKRQATKAEVDSKVDKSQLDTDGSLTTSKTEVPTMYTLAKIARNPFKVKWKGSSNSVTIDGLTSTYGLEVKVTAGYAFKFEFSYDANFSTFVGWYDPKNNKYIEVRQDYTSFTVTSYGGLNITRVEIRENFVGGPL